MHKERNFMSESDVLFVSNDNHYNNEKCEKGRICKICDRKFMIFKTHQKYNLTMGALKKEISNNDTQAEQEFEDYIIARK